MEDSIIPLSGMTIIVVVRLLSSDTISGVSSCRETENLSGSCVWLSSAKSMVTSKVKKGSGYCAGILMMALLLMPASPVCDLKCGKRY